MLKKATFALALVNCINSMQITEETEVEYTDENSITIDEFLYDNYGDIIDTLMNTKPEDHDELYDYLWGLWDILWEFENFEMYIEKLDDTSDEF